MSGLDQATRDLVDSDVAVQPADLLLVNGNHPDGLELTANLGERAVNLQDALPGGWLYLIVELTVADSDHFDCGEEALGINFVAWATNASSGDQLARLQTSANIKVVGPCG